MELASEWPPASQTPATATTACEPRENVTLPLPAASGPDKLRRPIKEGSSSCRGQSARIDATPPAQAHRRASDRGTYLGNIEDLRERSRSSPRGSQSQRSPCPAVPRSAVVDRCRKTSPPAASSLS